MFGPSAGDVNAVEGGSGGAFLDIRLTGARLSSDRGSAYSTSDILSLDSSEEERRGS